MSATALDTASEPGPASVRAVGRVERRRRAAAQRDAVATGFLSMLTGVLTVLVVAPRLDNPLFRDEAVSADVASRTWSQVWATVQNVDAAHGAYYFFLSALPLRLDDTTALRLASLLPVALAGVLLTAWVCRRLSIGAGVLVALTWPVLPATVAVSLFARGYGLVLLMAVVSGLVLLSLLTTPDGVARRGAWVGYCLSLVVLGYLSLLALLLVAAHGVAVLALVRRPGGVQRMRVWALAVGAAAIGLLPLLVLAASQPDPISWVAPPLLSDLGTIPVRVLGGSNYGTDDAPAGAALVAGVLVVLCAVAVVLGVVRRRAARDDVDLDASLDARSAAVLVGASWLVVPLAAALVVSLREPMFVARYLWFVAPAVALLLATLVPGSVRGRLDVRALAVALVVPLAVLVAGWGPRQALLDGGVTADYRGVVAALKAQAQPGDVLVNDGYVDLFGRSGLAQAAGGALPVPDALVVVPASELGTLAPQELPPDEWPQALADANRVWVVGVENGMVRPREEAAAQGHTLVSEQVFDGIVLRLYATAPGGR